MFRQLELVVISLLHQTLLLHRHVSVFWKRARIFLTHQLQWMLEMDNDIPITRALTVAPQYLSQLATFHSSSDSYTVCICQLLHCLHTQP
jgi:hypothetical protein